MWKVCVKVFWYTHTHSHNTTPTANPAVFISAEIQYVLAGNTTSLVATVHAHPSVDMAGWYLNNTPIDTGGHYTVSVANTMHTLRIQNVREDQLGLYEFVATVGNQTASDSIRLVFPSKQFYMT